MLDAMRRTAVERDKPLSSVVFEDVFQAAPDDPSNPTTYFGIFDKQVAEAGGFDACTPEQLEDFDRVARETLESYEMARQAS